MLTAARVVTVVIACTCAASAAQAQYPQRRDGFWIGFGLGYGSANVSCDNFTETIANVTASIYFYPQARGGFFLTGGVGFSGYHANTVPSSDGTGWGFTGGAGYDIRVGRDVSLTPVVNFVYGALADFDVPVSGGGIVRARNWRQNVVDLGLGVTFH